MKKVAKKSAKKTVRRFNLKKLVIDRKKWLRGTGAGELRDSKGKMCCLGFAALACGVPVRAIRGKAMPLDLSSGQQKRLPEYFLELLHYKGLSGLASEVNDSRSLSDEARERDIKELFAGEGVKVTFVN